MFAIGFDFLQVFSFSFCSSQLLISPYKGGEANMHEILIEDLNIFFISKDFLGRVSKLLFDGWRIDKRFSGPCAEGN